MTDKYWHNVARIYVFVLGFTFGTLVTPFWVAFLWCIGIIAGTHMFASALEEKS